MINEIAFFLLGIATTLIILLLYSHREIPVVCPKCGDRKDINELIVRCQKCKNLFKYKDSQHRS